MSILVIVTAVNIVIKITILINGLNFLLIIYAFIIIITFYRETKGLNLTPVKQGIKSCLNFIPFLKEG